MVNKVELIPLSEGNRITVKENEKVIIGRGSSLGCNEKKISRHHAELVLKDDNTLWIKPTHTNPVFFRSSNSKTIQLAKDIERELKDGDQIGLLPSTYYFRICFSIDVNNNQDTNESNDSDSVYAWKNKEDRPSTSDDCSPTRVPRRSINKENSSIFDFDDDIRIESTITPPLPERKSIEKKTTTTDVIPKSPTQSVSPEQSPLDTTDQDDKSRKLPKWMASPVVHTPTTKSSFSRNSSYTTPTSIKRNMSFNDDNNNNNNNEMNELSNISDSRSPGKVLSRISSTKSFDDTSDGEVESITIKSPPPAKKPRSSGKRRPACQFGSTCYRKNPVHRAEQSHPGDSDYDEPKSSNNSDDNDINKPECPFGRSCYRQNPQHKRDFRH